MMYKTEESETEHFIFTPIVKRLVKFSEILPAGKNLRVAIIGYFRIY